MLNYGTRFLKLTTMTYQPITAVWEITMGCNMRCKHCGSSCTNPLPDELSTEEALDLVDQIADLGLSWITLSGGEPFIRKDWHLIARRLSDKGVIPNIISNGWLVTDDTISKIKEAKVGTIAISLDGLKETHDFIRKPGSYDRVIKALQQFVANEVVCGVVTTISNANIHQLKDLRNVLIDLKVPYWQVQIGLPMGNFAKEEAFILKPEQINDIIDFCYETAKGGEITLYPADCIGYYNIKELETRQIAHNTESLPLWRGCNAGKRGFGVLHNGDIMGCTSIRDRQYIEGNIRTTSLKDIWNNPDNFKWNRTATKAQLKGECNQCKFGNECLGGCPNTRLTMEKDLFAENKFCSYNVGMKKTRAIVAQRYDVKQLMDDAFRYIEEQEYQIAAIVLERVIELDPSNLEALKYHGFVNFFMQNLHQAEHSNRKALEMNPEDVYSLKGLGITLYKKGEKTEGIDYLKQAVSLTDSKFMDPYFDLALIYMDNNQQEEAKALLKNAQNVDSEFYKQNQALYDQVFA
jgi:radical SAM protein with 4Fe4S-binding SPASM domain